MIWYWLKQCSKVLAKAGFRHNFSRPLVLFTLTLMCYNQIKLTLFDMLALHFKIS